MNTKPVSPVQPELEEQVGFQQLIGVRLVEWEPDYAVLVLDLDPRHLNRSGVPHGGLLCTLLDAVCGYSGLYSPLKTWNRKAVTLSLSTNFLAQSRGSQLRAVGRRISGGQRIFNTTGEIYDEHGVLIATAQGTHRYRTGSSPADRPL
ncbi:hypothetical protein GCM10011348_21970 [Marinobacterium nitratireducens]|uniref:Thioesterase domain-containing protein n=1 Tax=Marinobacterium nitratireducens TaxID=518897 RepID=A0A918DTB9_9GAMM|nr:PaaI family thioesterase [Marinobacterium nitratireducens]GGO81898.1 hypothetical protein GCM10011348_21970 [Marinobacterium nitratireducens]